jgi:hypothetical protein
MADAQAVIIVHTLEHTVAALRVAASMNLPVTLQSAPDAVHYAGSLYLLRMFEAACEQVPEAKAAFILDCGDSGAQVLGALQAGHRAIRTCAKPALTAKLADITGQYGAQLYNAPYDCIDLHHERDIEAACRNWLMAHAKD